MAASSEAASGEAPAGSPDGQRLALAEEFPAVERERWQALVAGVLSKSAADTEGVEAVETLLATTLPDGFAVGPLHTAADTATAIPAGLPGRAPFTRGRRPQGSVAGGWDVRAPHRQQDPALAKDDVLADLENGAGSLWLTLGEGGLPIDSLGDVLAGVYLDLAPVVLDAGAEYAAAADALFAVLAERGVRPGEVRGNLGADPLGVAARTGARADLSPLAALANRTHESYPELQVVAVDALPYHEAGGTDGQELACALAAGVEYLRALTASGLDPAAACGLLEFRYAATADQFATIAKLRAARRLWARVAEVAGVPAAAAGQRQHAVTSPVMMTRRDPWVNMLRTTLACFGAGIGGADAITVLPFDAELGLPDGFARRIARNTQSLLLDESRLAQVIDPAGGSWYVERLTDELAEAAWAMFQDIERAGGLAAALDAGLIAERLAAAWTARSTDIAHRRTPITGVSEFPNLAETLPSRPAGPAAPGGGLPKVRLAQDFEALRDRSDAVLAETGRRPAVFLATLGPIPAHSARAGFAGNLLQAGGIETPEAGATQSAEDVVAAFRDSGARVVCLCGNDALYAERAAETVDALRDAGATHVLIAGKPGAAPDSGADTHLYAGCDALAVLAAAYDALEI